jgi:hypothetical protein
MAVCSVVDPGGVLKIGVVYMKDTGASNYEFWLAVFDKTLTFVQKHFICTNFGAATVYPVRSYMVQCSPAIDGSVIISIRNRYDRQIGQGSVSPTASSRVLRWYGGCPTNSLANVTTTATITATAGSTTVTGGAAEIAKISFPGVYIQDVGVVASVTNTTTVQLMYPCTLGVAAVATIFFIAGTLPVARARGRISATAAVLNGLVGYGTKFTEAREKALLAPGKGFDFIDPTNMLLTAQLNGGAAPFVSDTLTGAPTGVPQSASLKNYLLYGAPGSVDFFLSRHIWPTGGGSANGFTPKVTKGSFWTTFKGFNISYNALVESSSTIESGDIATTARFYIHGPRFPEIMDHSVADGDWGETQATKIGDADGIAIQGGQDAVVLCKAQESFSLIGDDPDNFIPNKIADDGALSFESITTWRGSVIWLGRTGIWMYDGATNNAVNITDATLGTAWKTRVAAFDGTVYGTDSDNYMLNQARCFVYKDYLFVNVTNTGSGPHSVYTDGVARVSNTMQLMIYLPTMACSFMTNFNFQGFLNLNNVGYVILPQLGSTTHHWFPLDNLFTQGLATVDTILTANSYNSGSVPTSVGPWFHIESRKYDIGDGLRRKTWKQLSIESFITNTKRLFMETVAGLNTTGIRAATPYTGSGLWKAAKIRFNDRGQYMSFRIYEDINNRPSTMQLGAWQWGYKVARRGQV